MIPGEQYSKDIQIMNLREDKAYHIFFYALPVDKSGEIDLEQECTTTITLEGEPLYQGLVTGDGNVDMTDTPLDLGLYESRDKAERYLVRLPGMQAIPVGLLIMDTN